MWNGLICPRCYFSNNPPQSRLQTCQAVKSEWMVMVQQPWPLASLKSSITLIWQSIITFRHKLPYMDVNLSTYTFNSMFQVFWKGGGNVFAGVSFCLGGGSLQQAAPRQGEKAQASKQKDQVGRRAHHLLPAKDAPARKNWSRRRWGGYLVVK